MFTRVGVDRRCILGMLALTCTAVILMVSAAAAQGSAGGIAIIVGTVTDARKVPVAGANVEALAIQTQVSRRTTTNAAGQYSIVLNDTSSNISVTVSAPAHANVTSTFTRQGGDNRIVYNAQLPEGRTLSDSTMARLGLPEIFRVARAADSMGRANAANARSEITGTVTDQSDKPIAGARVLVTPAGAMQSEPAVDSARITTTTDDRGRFTIVTSSNAPAFRVMIGHVGFVAILQEIPRAAHFVLDVRMGVAALIVSGPWRREVIPRSSLLAGDAADFWMGGGDISVTGTDDDFITYQVVQRPGTFAGDSTPDAFMRQNERGTHIISGFGVRAIGGPGMELRVTVPRTLHSLKLVTGHYGAIHVEHFSGELSVQSERGDIELADVSGPTLGEARSGEVRVAVSHVPATGTAGLNLLGRNGNITLTLPPDAQAELSLDVHHGTVTSDFTEGSARIVVNASDLEALRKIAPEVQPVSREFPRRIIRDLGGGGVPVIAVALNGNIIVKKAVAPPRE